MGSGYSPAITYGSCGLIIYGVGGAVANVVGAKPAAAAASCCCCRYCCCCSNCSWAGVLAAAAADKAAAAAACCCCCCCCERNNCCDAKNKTKQSNVNIARLRPTEFMKIVKLRTARRSWAERDGVGGRGVEWWTFSGVLATSDWREKL